MFRNKSFSDELFLFFPWKVHNLTVFSIIFYDDSNSIFRAGRIISEGVFGRTVISPEEMGVAIFRVVVASCCGVGCGGGEVCSAVSSSTVLGCFLDVWLLSWRDSAGAHGTLTFKHVGSKATAL